MCSATNNELLAQMTYNAQHLPLTIKDAAGQVTVYSYNAAGQVLSETNPKNETTSYTYDTNGYLTSVDGPLPGPGDTTSWAYDAMGRLRTKTDVDGYTLKFDYDALDRVTRVTFPSSPTVQPMLFRKSCKALLSMNKKITSFCWAPNWWRPSCATDSAAAVAFFHQLSFWVVCVESASPV